MRHSPSTSTRTVPSGNFTILCQTRHAADFVQILRGLGSATSALELQHRAKQAVAGDEVVNEFEAGPGFNEQRHDGAGKNDDVRQAEDGQVFRQ